MSEQIVNIVVRQASSGSALSVSMTYSSDGNLVRKTRDYLRNAGGYTMEGRMPAELRHAVVDLVQKLSDEGQLF